MTSRRCPSPSACRQYSKLKSKEERSGTADFQWTLVLSADISGDVHHDGYQDTTMISMPQT
uniref:Uncharacterized protein n=1 Tax=Triticum urartu TaxID=4572 RepID=A0A8R7V8C3_TRIUA